MTRFDDRVTGNIAKFAPAARAAEIPTTFGEPDDDDDSPADHRWAALRGLRPDGDPDSSD